MPYNTASLSFQGGEGFTCDFMGYDAVWCCRSSL